MTKKITNPIAILAVKNVKATSVFLTEAFNWKSVHGGEEFDILMTEDNTPALLLHDFSTHEHQRFQNLDEPIGVGQSLYVFVEDLDVVYENIQVKKMEIVEPLFLNKNSRAKEFTFKIKEGYQFSVCETAEWMFYNIN